MQGGGVFVSEAGQVQSMRWGGRCSCKGQCSPKNELDERTGQGQARKGRSVNSSEVELGWLREEQ